MKFAIVLVVLLVALPSAYAEEPETAIGDIKITFPRDWEQPDKHSYATVRAIAQEAVGKLIDKVESEATEYTFIAFDFDLRIDAEPQQGLVTCIATIVARKVSDSEIVGRETGYHKQTNEQFDYDSGSCALVAIWNSFKSIYMDIAKELREEKYRRRDEKRLKRRKRRRK